MIHVSGLRFPTFYENTYIVYDETKSCIVIDPGCITDKEKQEIYDYISYYKLKPVRLINTHCHLDHVIGNKFILENYDVPLSLNKNEVQFLEAMPEFGKRKGYHVDPLPKDYNLIEEGDEVNFGNSSFKVLNTPGHSPGSISLFSSQGILISGDVLFKDRIGSVDLPGACHATLIQVIKEKIFSLEDNVLIYPGHGPGTSVGYEKKYNSFACGMF